MGESDPGDARRRGEEILTSVNIWHSIYKFHSFDNSFILDLQSIGSSPGLHILCARDTIMIPFRTRTWDSFLRLGGTGAYI